MASTGRGKWGRMRERAELEPSDHEQDDGDSSSGTADEDGSSDGGDEPTDPAESGDEWDDEVTGNQKASGNSGSGAAGTSNDLHEQSIEERLARLAHGAGPSRRRRGQNQAADGEIPAAVPSQARQGKSKERRAVGYVQEGGVTDNKETKARSRANKNRPQEVSSSRAVGRHREVVATKRRNFRDPRFEGGGGSSKLNYDIFRKAYGFLEDYQDSEIEELKKSLKKEKNQERSLRLQTLLTRLQQERAERSQGDRKQQALREVRKRERDAVALGKAPYFLKSSEKKRLSLEQRYEGLKKEGKLGKFMEKKRKKNAAKDHRWLPSKRESRG